MLSIVQIYDWPTAIIEEMVFESEREGFRFVRRAQEEWRSGANRFSKDGEALFAVFEDDRLLAIGGVNRESERCGRLRRLYVRHQERRKRVGAHLVQHVMSFSRQHYSRVVLRCDTEAGDQFYRSLGFTHSAADSDVSRSIELKKEPIQSRDHARNAVTGS